MQTIDITTHIHTLPQTIQDQLKARLMELLDNNELDVYRAINGRICDIEELIDVREFVNNINENNKAELIEKENLLNKQLSELHTLIRQKEKELQKVEIELNKFR